MSGNELGNYTVIRIQHSTYSRIIYYFPLKYWTKAAIGKARFG